MHELLSGHIDSEKNEAEIISYLSIKPGDKFLFFWLNGTVATFLPSAIRKSDIFYSAFSITA